MTAGDAEYRDFFESEIRTLTYILIFFSVSYLMRVIYDIVGLDLILEKKQFIGYLTESMTAILFDLLPIFVVLNFHRRNLRQMNQKRSEHNIPTLQDSATIVENEVDFSESVSRRHLARTVSMGVFSESNNNNTNYNNSGN